MEQKLLKNNIWHHLVQYGQTIILFSWIMALGLTCAPQPTSPQKTVPKPKSTTAYVSNANYLCEEGVQSSGALYRICLPQTGWNGDLFIWAHGYVSPTEPIQLDDNPELIATITGAGYAYATTSYRKNGLAIKEGIDDLLELVEIFKHKHGPPRYTYLVGGSEGGIITALSIERHPNVYSGGLSLCGPNGDFQKQINYFGDFRLLFDYFFPGILPGDPLHIPQELIEHFFDKYVPRILDAIHANPHATDQLLRITHAAHDPNDPTTIDNTVISVLWFNVFSTNEAQQELGGQMFDNMGRYYKGSDDDATLNRSIPRYQADATALKEIATYYQTHGNLRIPLVSLHTVGDPVVPFWQQPLYRWKVWNAGAISSFHAFPVFRYGHCNFTPEEVLAAFELLVYQVTRNRTTSQILQMPSRKSEPYFSLFAPKRNQLFPYPQF